MTEVDPAYVAALEQARKDYALALQHREELRGVELECEARMYKVLRVLEALGDMLGESVVLWRRQLREIRQRRERRNQSRRRKELKLRDPRRSDV